MLMPSLNLTYLEKISELVSYNDYFQRKTKSVKGLKGNKGYTYQYYNQVCTCILRVRETSNYLEHFPFKRSNEYQQAFDFYEFINCVAIVFGCVEQLFNTFGLSLEQSYLGKAFTNSCPGKTSDVQYFKFLRSASSMHPANTNRHNKITKHSFEVYPYALWCKDSMLNYFMKVPKWADIELLSWNAKTKGKDKRYYVSIDEIYTFVGNCLDSLKEVVKAMEELLVRHKESVRCKRLLAERSFNTYGEYLLYLRKRLISRQSKDESADGGLLLASFIIESSIISDDFKKYIKKRVSILVAQMKKDIDQISYGYIFEELSLYDVIRDCDPGGYKSEKFHDYLYHEAIREIEERDFIDFREEDCPTSNRGYSVCLLNEIKNYLYPNGEFEQASSYADLYAITLQRIFEMKKDRAKQNQ